MVNFLQQHGWGLVELEIERDLLAVGKFGLRRARGTFPDGTLFEMPGGDSLPVPIEINSELRNQVVNLAIPWRRPRLTHGATTRSNANRPSDAMFWRLQSAEELDIAAQQSPLRLYSEAAAEFAQIPLAHIIECRLDKQVVLDERFIPTVMICAAAPRLADFLLELSGLVHQRAESLAARVDSSRRGGAAEVTEFLMLQSLNRYEPLVRQLALTAYCRPEDLHRLALEIAGDLATFTSTSRRPIQFPAYRHDALRSSFEPVIQALRTSLSVVLEQSAVLIPLTQKKYGISVGTVADRTLWNSAVFVLAARSELGTDELLRRLPDQLTIAPVEKIATLVNNRTSVGIAVHAMPVAPRKIPHHAGFAYFEFDRTSTLWRALHSSAGIAIHSSGELSGLSLEIWAIQDGSSPAPTSDIAGSPSAHLPPAMDRCLTLEVISGPDIAKVSSRSFTFGIDGGTIGRSPDCDWVLTNPHVSRHHAIVRWISGAYYIESTGTNGVAVNSPQAILPQMERRALNSGDRLFIDEYEIAVALGSRAPTARSAFGPASGVLIPSDDPFSDLAPLSPSPDLMEHAKLAMPEPVTPDVEENLQFTVYRPRQLIPQLWQPLLAFAHLSERPADADPMQPDPIEEVASQAEAFLRERIHDYRPIVQPAGQTVSRDSELTFLPMVDGLEFEPPQHRFAWEGSVHREVFLVRAGAEFVGRTLRGRLAVFLGRIVIAEVPLSIPIAAETRGNEAGNVVPMETARRYRKIFASYSRKDESIVEECERYARVLGDEYMRDVVSLRAGEVWSTRLQALIATADVFQLFWSWNSMDSSFVRSEWEHALRLGRPEFIRPVYWEDPLPSRPEKNLPPQSLQTVHFQRLPARRDVLCATSIAPLGSIPDAPLAMPPCSAQTSLPRPACAAPDDRGPMILGDRKPPAARKAAQTGSLVEDHPNHQAAAYAKRPAAGSVINNRFVLEEEIGRGETGIVFKARDIRKDVGESNPYVAIKVLNKKFQYYHESLAALQRDGRTALSLSHPNIATVYEFDGDGNNVFGVMELLEGEALDRLIERVRGSGLKSKEALRISRDICQAMAYAHDRGVVHSDFKPADAFLTREGVVKVLDFGIPRMAQMRNQALGSTTVIEMSTLSGLTPAYASCEMIEGLEPDVRDDVYSIACVTYELLSGNHPFGRMSAVQARDAKLVATRPQDLSRSQWRTLQKGLAFRRDERPTDVSAFAKGLESGWLW